MQDFVDCCQQNQSLQINTGKTKELVVDLRRRTHSQLSPVNIRGMDIEMVTSSKFLGVHLNNKLDWTLQEGPEQTLLRSFGVQGGTPDSVASAIFYGDG